MDKATMRAIRVHQYGGPEQLKLEEVPRPEPGEGEILVRIHAAGVLPMDCGIRQGLFPGVLPSSFPYTPGSAFSGVIEALGPSVTNFHQGQAICGRCPNGSYAEHATINTSPPPLTPGMERSRHAAVIPLAPKPESYSFDEAATLSAGATTAWTALFEEDVPVQAGQRVLIHGAAGGVGLFAVQFAKWKGAHVIGTSSAANMDFVRSLGADQVIDYNSTPFEEAVQDVDFVLDTVGGETLLRSMHIVKRGGSLVSLVEEPPEELSQQLGIRAINNQVAPNSEHLHKIVEVINAGHAKPAIQQRFSLQEAPAAHALCETGHGRGRIVLHIAD